MNKEYIVYGIGGIVLGLVLGFYSANWFGPKPVPGAMAASTGEKSTSVNSPGPGRTRSGASAESSSCRYRANDPGSAVAGQRVERAVRRKLG